MHTVTSNNLKGKHCQSCGCLFKEVRSLGKSGLKHGLYGTKEYRAWQGMKRRCLYKSHKNYKHYGGRGIKVCPEWQNDFLAFYNHIGRAPGKEYTVDRIDNEGNYEPGNVRWATKSEQSKNQRKRRMSE